MFPLAFRAEVNHEETRVMGISSSEDRMNDRSCVSRFDTVPACDRQTDRQTDGFTIANTALCIASYADAL